MQNARSSKKAAVIDVVCYKSDESRRRSVDLTVTID